MTRLTLAFVAGGLIWPLMWLLLASVRLAPSIDDMLAWTTAQRPRPSVAIVVGLAGVASIALLGFAPPGAVVPGIFDPLDTRKYCEAMFCGRVATRSQRYNDGSTRHYCQFHEPPHMVKANPFLHGLTQSPTLHKWGPVVFFAILGLTVLGFSGHAVLNCRSIKIEDLLPALAYAPIFTAVWVFRTLGRL